MALTFFRIAILLLIISFLSPVPAPAQSPDILQMVIPRPEHVKLGEGGFTVDRKTAIVIAPGSGDLRNVAKLCSDGFKSIAGWPLTIRRPETLTSKKNYIVLAIDRSDDALAAEGYRLTVTPSIITISAKKSAGVFYGVQSLLQMLPNGSKGRRSLFIGSSTIEDAPRFPWRGMHLDVSRHFFSTAFIKKYIDMLAMHKFNTFHWHLTDDQGWRIEIKKYPQLTGVGAWRVNRENQSWNFRTPQKEGEMPTYGGYYTQKDIREIVRYAAQRCITIVPEIEMPAHATAALAAYPQFSCSGGPFHVAPGGVWPLTDIFCAGNDSTFLFLQNILSEVMDLFPGQFIHVGGDEADKTEWKKCPKCQARIAKEGLRNEGELQSYFTKRIERFIRSKGRRLIGWDEILEGGLPPDAAVMSWRGTTGGTFAARNGHDVVMTPGEYSYLDHYQGNPTYEPEAIGGFLPLSKVYAFEPVPDSLTPEQARHILGAQGNVWSEYIPTPEHAEYMTLPRMAAMAEVLWSPRDSRDWTNFAQRVDNLIQRYELLGYHSATSAYRVSVTPEPDTLARRMLVSLSTEMPGVDIHYTLDGNTPSVKSPVYSKPVLCEKTTLVRAAAFRGDSALTGITEEKVFVHNAFLRPVTLRLPFEKYAGGGRFGLTNGICGTSSFGDQGWQGFHQNDLDAVIDLGRDTSIGKITTHFLESIASYIFLPTVIVFAVSSDGITYNSVATFENPVPTSLKEPAVKEYAKELTGIRGRFVRLTAKNVGVCPDWHIGKGDKAWIFVDEIIVE